MTSASARSKPQDEAPASEERASVGDAFARIRAAMERAPEVDWLSPEQRAECDQALEDLRAGRARLAPREEVLDALAGLPADK